MNSVRTSQEAHYVSATEPNRLILFRETVAVYCENNTEHTDIVRTSQETHYVSATEPNRLILSRKTVAVYCEDRQSYITTDSLSVSLSCCQAPIWDHATNFSPFFNYFLESYRFVDVESPL
jgi:predicted Zn-dependent protease with MMP-like domain